MRDAVTDAEACASYSARAARPSVLPQRGILKCGDGLGGERFALERGEQADLVPRDVGAGMEASSRNDHLSVLQRRHHGAFPGANPFHERRQNQLRMLQPKRNLRGFDVAQRRDTRPEPGEGRPKLTQFFESHPDDHEDCVGLESPGAQGMPLPRNQKGPIGARFQRIESSSRGR